MRHLKPLCISAAVALALTGGTAFAQLRIGGATTTNGATASTSTTGTNTTGTTSTTGTSANSTAVGGCTGSGGSSCTASNSNTAGTTTTGGTTTTTNTLDAVSATNPGTGATTTTAGDTSTPSRSAQGTNSVSTDPTLSRPGAFDAGGAFGPTAVPAATNTTGTVENGIVLPTTGSNVNPGSQQNVFVQPQQVQSAAPATPIFDQAAREGRARDQRRKATGNEPRVIGIAPRTDRDLTWQMPDDPIIRY